MSRGQLLPHHTLPDDAVSWGAWTCSHGGAPAVALPESLIGWDQSMALTLETTAPDVDEAALRDCVGNASVLFVGVVDCRDTSARYISTHLFGAGDAGFTITLPPGSIAGQLLLQQHLVVGDSETIASAHTPSRPGSRLAASPSRTVRIEGGPTSFPTEAFSFRTAGIEPVPWKLQVDTSDLDASFMGAVRLWVNTDHPAGRALLDPAHAQFKALTSVVKYETVGQLIGSLPDDVIDEAGPDEDQDSLGAVVGRFANTWVGADLADAIHLLRTEPVSFWTRVAQKTKLLEDIR